jgi:hypothetical protein
MRNFGVNSILVGLLKILTLAIINKAAMSYIRKRKPDSSSSFWLPALPHGLSICTFAMVQPSVRWNSQVGLHQVGKKNLMP